MKRFVVPLLVLTACAAGKGDDDVDDAVARAAKPAAGAPGLTGPAAGAKDRVAEFVTWAAASKASDAPEVRKQLGLARADAAVAAALADHAADAQDHSRSLVALALLGEMRSPAAEAHLKRFIDRPLPPQATGGDGENDARGDAEMLAAKAVDGLAYLRSPSADSEVLRIAGHHESRAVRAEAIDAYLFNHGDSEEARAALAQVIVKEDAIFLDRPRYVAGESAESIDAKLAAYLAKHPELNPPPVPAKREEGAQ